MITNKINRDIVLHYLYNYLTIIREIDSYYSGDVDPYQEKDYEFKKACILAITNLYSTIPLYECELLKYRFNKGLSIADVCIRYGISRSSLYLIQKKFIDRLIIEFNAIYKNIYGENECG